MIAIDRISFRRPFAFIQEVSVMYSNVFNVRLTLEQLYSISVAPKLSSDREKTSNLSLRARHEALLDIADVICTYRNGQSLMHHHAARLKKHNRNKRVAVSIAASWNRTSGLGSVVQRALCNPPSRFTGSPEVWPWRGGRTNSQSWQVGRTAGILSHHIKQAVEARYRKRLICPTWSFFRARKIAATR